MRITPKDIQEQTFRVTLRGFDAEEVDKYLEAVAQEIETLIEEKETLARQLEEERQFRQEMEKSLAAAGQIHEAVMVKAREEAASVTLAAQTNAGNIILDAERTASQMVADAREKAAAFRQSLEAIREKRISMLSDMAGMAETLRHWVDQQPGEPADETTEALDAAFRVFEEDDALDEILETFETEAAEAMVAEAAAEPALSFQLAEEEAEPAETTKRGFRFTFGDADGDEPAS